MRLQPKQQIAATVASQKKEQIDQGVQLASRIDALRETLGKEEKRLAEFRESSTRLIQVEIDERIRERDRLELEIARRQQERAVLLVPLDTAWDEVNKAKSEIENEKARLAERDTELKEGINLNILRERMNEDETKRIEEERRRADVLLSKAAEIKQDALDELSRTRGKAALIIKAAEEREEAVAVRETELETEKSTLKARTKSLTAWENDLKRREKKLKANQEVLTRTQNYLKNKK